MNCADCNTLLPNWKDITQSDYLCGFCRLKAEPLTQTPSTILNLIGYIVELNREESYIHSWEDEHEAHPLVTVRRPIGSQWTHVNLSIEETTEFPNITQLRVVKEFVIWGSSPDIYEVKYGEVEDEPIPESEYRTRLVL